MKRRTLVITLIIALVLCGCSKSEHDETTADFDPRMELETPRLVASPDTSAHPESRIAETEPERELEYMRLPDGTLGRIIKGDHDGYSYWYVEPSEGRDGIFGGGFKPFLPRNDAVVTSMLKHLVRKVYGQAVAERLDESAHLEHRNGRNLIVLWGVQSKYLFGIIKEDTGEVHSFFMWREPW